MRLRLYLARGAHDEPTMLERCAGAACFQLESCMKAVLRMMEGSAEGFSAVPKGRNAWRPLCIHEKESFSSCEEKRKLFFFEAEKKKLFFLRRTRKAFFFRKIFLLEERKIKLFLLFFLKSEEEGKLFFFRRNPFFSRREKESFSFYSFWRKIFFLL